MMTVSVWQWIRPCGGQIEQIARTFGWTGRI